MCYDVILESNNDILVFHFYNFLNKALEFAESALVTGDCNVKIIPLLDDEEDEVENESD